MGSIRILRTDTVTYVADVSRQFLLDLLECSVDWEDDSPDGVPDAVLAEEVSALAGKDFEVAAELRELAGKSDSVTDSELEIFPR